MTVVCNVAVSVDCFSAGPDQSLELPLGRGGEGLHRWMFEDPEANAPEIEAITAVGANPLDRADQDS